MTTTRRLADHDEVTVLDSQATRRSVTVASLGGIALIHLLDLDSKIHELPYVGWLFIGVTAGTLLIAEGLMRSDDLRWWAAAGTLAGLIVLGYIVSRTIGLPGDGGGDKGNWVESLGLASIMLEGIVVLLVIARFTAARKN